jgi:hypothetical protein
MTLERQNSYTKDIDQDVDNRQRFVTDKVLPGTTDCAFFASHEAYHDII